MLVLTKLIKYIKQNTNINKLYTGYIHTKKHLCYECIAYIKHNKTQFKLLFDITDKHLGVYGIKISGRDKDIRQISDYECDSIMEEHTCRKILHLLDLLLKKYIDIKHVKTKYRRSWIEIVDANIAIWDINGKKVNLLQY